MVDSEVQTRFLGADSLLFATAHRPWPLPEGNWLMTQTWNDLLFAHYAFAPSAIRALVPEALTLDLYDGAAWVTLTPFWIKNLRPPGLPALPVISQFPELNVRTYVTYRDKSGVEKPGVYFFSLDAGNLSAVWGARMFYRLPYWHADMKVEGKDEISFRSKRIHGPKAGNGMPEFRARYWATGLPKRATPGSLPEFLSERYCLYAWNRAKLYRAEIHHLPWPLQMAECDIEINTMCEPLGFSLPRQPNLTQVSRMLKVLVWPPEKLL
ncbi:MAG TPA: DUF2071 domain-containing protein [Terriglobales bacterium]